VVARHGREVVNGHEGKFETDVDQRELETFNAEAE
jgi:hypothetical protein